MKRILMNLKIVVIVLISLLLPGQNIVLGQTYIGPSATAPGNNPPGPVWLQNTSSQYQHGKIYLGTNAGDDLFVRSGNSIRADVDSGSGAINVSNYGTSPAGFTLNVRGNVRLDGSLAGTPGNLYVPQICLGPSGTEVCRTSWPSGTVGGSGTTNYIPKFTAAGSLGDSLIFENSFGNVGIGNSAVTQKRARLNIDGSPVGIDATGTNIGVYGFGSSLGLYGVGETGVYGRATEDVGVTGEGVTGVSALGSNYGLISSGAFGGGIFTDSDSSGMARVAYGNLGILAQGTTAGGYFLTPDGSGSGYIGYTGYGVLAYGDTAGAYFSNNLTSAQGGIGQGSYGIRAYGRAAGAGARIQNIDSNGEASIATTNYGIDAIGNMAGGNFTSFDGTGGATLGITGNWGGNFWNSNASQAQLASGAYGILGYGRAGGDGGYFTNIDAPGAPYAELGTVSHAGRFFGQVSIATPGTGNFISLDVLNSSCGPGCGTGIKSVTTGGVAGIFKYNDADTDNQVQLGIFNPGGGQGMDVRGYTSAAVFTNSATPANTVTLATQGVAIAANGMAEFRLTDDTNPINITSWNSRHVVFGNGNAGAIGMSWDRANNVGYITALSPSVAWRHLIIQQGSGNLGIGGPPPDYKLQVYGTAGKSDGSTTWYTFSDIRLKDVVGSYERGLDAITKLDPILYHYKDNKDLGLDPKPEHIGLSAQDVQKIIPEAISVGADGYLSMNSDAVIYTMINSIKELKVENDTLKARLDALEKKVQ